MLLEDEHLGDRSLTEFLHCIHELADGSMEESSFVKQLFFSWPLNVQLILALMVEGSLMDQIAMLVDKILEFSRESSTASRVVAVASSSSAAQDSSTVELSGHTATLKGIKDLAH
ncbi:Hypothetical predicted protein [Octopus vulgaris]|uniref:Uncharacterized protein n=1 Tax=Octopus vulgaris TaxID=6645 RepID=A0AA36AIV1_OCTVU|nr:Hypothetical predicted protein [Octopus vulgaris]